MKCYCNLCLHLFPILGQHGVRHKLSFCLIAGNNYEKEMVGKIEKSFLFEMVSDTCLGVFFFTSWSLVVA